MSQSKKLIAQLDQWFPPRGPCGLCGGEDARHRLWDQIMDDTRDEEEIAKNFDVDIEAVKAVKKIRPYRRR